MERLNKKIRSDFMPHWNEDMGGVHTNDEKRTMKETMVAFDANSIEDGDFENIVNIPVYDVLGREIGSRAVIKKKMRL